MGLKQLIARRDNALENLQKARAKYDDSKGEILKWGREQLTIALEKKGILPGKSVVRMDVRKKRNGRIVIEQETVFLDRIGIVSPPTMERGSLGPNASSTNMWWSAHMAWRNIRKDGELGATYGSSILQGNTLKDLVSKIERVRFL